MTQRVLVVTQVAVVNGEVSGLAMPTRITLTPKTTQGIQVSGWKDALSGSYINVTVSSFSGAQLNLSLLDENSAVVPECNNVPMQYVPGSNGNYVAVFGDGNFTPPVGSGYTLVVDGNDGGGNTFHLELVAEISSTPSNQAGASSAAATSSSLTFYALTPSPNGVITAFTAAVNVSGGAIVVRNGIVQTNGVDYNVSGNTVTFFTAPGAGDSLGLYQ